MPAPKFTLALTGSAPNLLASKEQLEDGINAALQELTTQLDVKAEIANSGKMFTGRSVAVAAGQGALPPSLGMIFTREGNYIAIRTPGSTADDPLFGTAPHWGVAMRVPSDALLNAEVTALNSRAVPLYASRDAAVAAAPSLPNNISHIEVREGTALVIRSRTAFADDPLFPDGARWGVVQRQDTATLATQKADLASPTFTGVPKAPNRGGEYDTYDELATTGALMALARIGISVDTLSHVGGVLTLTTSQLRRPVISFTGISLAQDIVIEIPTGLGVTYTFRNLTFRRITVRHVGQTGGVVVESNATIAAVSNGFSIVRVNDLTPDIQAVSDRVTTLNGLMSRAADIAIGRPLAPVTGSNIPASTYIYAESATITGQITRVRAWCMTAGQLTLALFSKGGNTVTRLRSHTVTLAQGANDIALPANALPINAGEYLGISTPAGRISFISGPGDNGGHWQIAQDAATGTVGAVIKTAQLQVGVQAVGAETVDVAGELDALAAQVGDVAAGRVVSDGRTLTRFRARVGTIDATGSGQARILMVGDSWAEHPRIPQQLRDVMEDRLGLSAYGWIDAIGWANTVLEGITYNRAGSWTTYSSATGGAVPAVGTGPDGKVIYTTASSATAQIIVDCEAFTIFYRNGDGVFRWRVDGGGWTVVTGNGSGGIGRVDIAGLTAGSHTIDIDTTGNGGTVALYGYLASSGRPGVVLHKAGTGGSTGGTFAKHIDSLTPYVADLAPDVAIIILGTNDYRSTEPISTYETALRGIVSRLRLAIPDVGVIFWAPAASNGTSIIPLSDYVSLMDRLSRELGVEFFSDYLLTGPYAQANALGMWLDGLHKSPAGARASVNALEHKLLF